MHSYVCTQLGKQVDALTFKNQALHMLHKLSIIGNYRTEFYALNLHKVTEGIRNKK